MNAYLQLLFHAILLRHSSGRERKIFGEIDKIEKYSEKYDGMQIFLKLRNNFH